MNIERDDGGLCLFGWVIGIVAGIVIVGIILGVAIVELTNAIRWVMA